MKLLALVESPDHVCCRYRIRAFAPALGDAGWSLTCEGLDRGALRPALPASPGVAVRRGDPAAQALARLAVAVPCAELRAISSSISTTPSCSAIRTIGAVPRVAGDLGGSRRRCALADTVVAGNDFLADCALRAGARVERVHVIPTCVDPRVYPIARHESSREPSSTWSGSVRRARSRDWSNRVRSGNGWRRRSLS